MLREIHCVSQVDGEPPRRWFFDHDIDLIVWLDTAKTVLGFQLCYGKLRDEYALSWLPHSGYTHSRVDNGEARPGRHKASPILQPAGSFDAAAVAREFLHKSHRIERSIAAFVHRKLLEFTHLHSAEADCIV